VNNSGALVDRRLEAGHGEKVAIRYGEHTFTYAAVHDSPQTAPTMPSEQGSGKTSPVVQRVFRSA